MTTTIRGTTIRLLPHFTANKYTTPAFYYVPEDNRLRCLAASHVCSSCPFSGKYYSHNCCGAAVYPIVKQQFPELFI